MNIHQKGFAHIGLVILFVVVVVMGGAGWYVYSKNTVGDPTPDIVPTPTTIDGTDDQEVVPMEVTTTDYKIEALGVYITLEPNWVVKEGQEPDMNKAYTITDPNSPITIVAFQSNMPAGFSSCADESEMTSFKVTELSNTKVGNVVVFGTDTEGLKLVRNDTLYASSIKSLAATKLAISDLQVGSNYYVCSSATVPLSWTVDFDNNNKVQDGVYAWVAGDGALDSTVNGYDAVIKMLRSVRR